MVILLNFILETFKNDERLDFVVLDGTKVSKADLKPITSEIVEIHENKFINLQAVKVVEFGHTPTPTESVEQLQRQVEALGKTW